MKAVYVTDSNAVLKDDVEVPVPADGEVLIRNVVVASNPKDYKVPRFFAEWEGIEGNDVAGYIEAVGACVTEFKKADKVAAFSKMFTAQKYGAYAEYTVAPASTTFPLGPKTSFEDAATLPLAVMTAGIGLFVRLGFPEPDESGERREVADPEPVVIWGASSSVGSFAVQLAKKAGLFVIAIAGAGKALPERLGADVIIDYRTTTDVESAVHAAVPKGKILTRVYDAVSTSSTINTFGRILSSSGGVITTVLNLPNGVSLPDNVKIDQTNVATAYGADEVFASTLYRFLGRWLEEGKFEGNKPRVMPNGLSSVPEGLKLLEEGKVSAEKLVYRIAETPGI